MSRSEQPPSSAAIVPDREVIAVVAVARSGVIGADGQIPWASPRDMRHFREITTGHPVIMGRKTFDSIGRPLPNRTNIVLTRAPQTSVPGVVFVSSREEAFAACGASERIMVIGGDQVYRQFYPDLTRIELTLVDADVDGDAFFSLDPSRMWRIEREDAEFDPKLGAMLTFRTYLPDTTSNRFLTKQTDELLLMFGAGEPVPGSGAAAALQALLAAYLAMTVIAKSRQHGSGNPRILGQHAFRLSAGLIPRLRVLFLRDIDVFEPIAPLRRRIKEATGRARTTLKKEEEAMMVEATEVPDAIFAIAEELVGITEWLYWNGWQAVRGDSGAAVSSAVAAMTSTTFIIGLNVEKLHAHPRDWRALLQERIRTSVDVLARMPALLTRTPPADPAQISLPFADDA